MLLYSVIMFLTGAVLAGLGIAIYRGKTNLIHDYHRTRVTDPKAYGKAFGKAMLTFSAAPLLSGAVGLFGDHDAAAMAAVIILLVGLGIGIGCIAAVQMKYNKGIF